MRKSNLLAAAFCLIAASRANADIVTQMFLDAGGGITATINVDGLGLVTCSGTCGGLVLPPIISPHRTLSVTGTLGNFTINATGVAGLDAISPTLQNLNQIDANAGGAGTLITEFTDTNYCGVGGQTCFGPLFILSASTVNDVQIAASTTDFFAFGNPANAVPAGTLIGSFPGLTGLSDSSAGVFPNGIGTGGSLTSRTNISFTGAGRVQANVGISTVAVPEPASLWLLTAVGCSVFLKRLRRA